MVQLQAILKSPEDEDEKIIFYSNPLIQKLSQYFIKFMTNWQLKLDEENKITVNKAHQLIESFLEILAVSLIKPNLQLLKQEDRSQAEKKVGFFV